MTSKSLIDILTFLCSSQKINNNNKKINFKKFLRNSFMLRFIIMGL